MPYDFFNTSNLAFGKRLTAAFSSLNDLADSAEDNLAQVFADQEIFQQYINRNYLVPLPTRPDAACRADEIYNVIDEKNFLTNISYSNGKFTVGINYFNNNTNKMTIGYGTTDIKEGSCYMIESISNSDPLKEIKFYDIDDNSYRAGTWLFDYRIDNRGYININGNSSFLNIKPFDSTQYSSMSRGSTVSLPYTSKDYECICVVGNKNNIDVKLNNTRVFYGTGDLCVRHCIIYTKPNDVISGTASTAFKVYYNK